MARRAERSTPGVGQSDLLRASGRHRSRCYLAFDSSRGSSRAPGHSGLLRAGRRRRLLLLSRHEGADHVAKVSLREMRGRRKWEDRESGCGTRDDVEVLGGHYCPVVVGLDSEVRQLSLLPRHQNG